MTHNTVNGRGGRQLGYCRQNRTAVGKGSVCLLAPSVKYVAIVVIPVVAYQFYCLCGYSTYGFAYCLLITLVISAHQRHSVRDEIGVALRVGRVGKGVGMIYESLAGVVHIVASHLHNELLYCAESGIISLLLGEALARNVEHLLQFFGAGSILRIASGVIAIASLRHIEHDRVVACLVSYVRVGVRLVCADVHLTVLDTVGVVHIGERKVHFSHLIVLVEVVSTAVQTLGSAVQTIVVGIAGIVTGCKRIAGRFLATFIYNVAIG